MKQFGKQTLVIAFLSAVTVTSLGITGWALFLRPAPKLTDYAPAELEPNAVVYDEDDGETKLGAGTNGGAVSISYTEDISISREKGVAWLHYVNPASSRNSVALQLVLVDSEGREAVVGQSGLLQPGTMLEELTLDDAGCQPGSYGGKYILTFYDPESGEKAILNTVLDGLKVTVE